MRITSIHVVQKVNQLLTSAISTGVSDIHFEPFEDVFRVRYRIDGVLKDVEHLPYAQKEEIISRIKIMSDLDIAEKRRPQDGKLVFGVSGKNVDVRVSVLPTQFGEKVVLRLLDREQVKLDISSLGMDDHEIDLFRKCIHLPYGMILVTGPTGSGKTTSLYSALSEINSEEVNITTIEDPIEYNLRGINQTQVHDKINYTFASILRTILRQDPDIIMIGEMRDTETADVSIRAALTGHLVLSTLHTNDAISTVVRLLHLDIEPFLIASSLRLIIAQRLIRVNCPHCSDTYAPDERVLLELGLLDSKIEYYRGRGCEECNHTWYKGHTVVDKAHGLVQAIKVTPANVFDGHMLIPLVESLELPEETEVLENKGYCSQDNKNALHVKNLVSKIMRKKRKNLEMPEETKTFNHSVSTQRYRVERSFGGLKKHFGWSRSIYMGLQKTANYLRMGAIAFNLKRSLKILRA